MNSLNLVSLTKINDALIEMNLRSCMLPVLRDSCDIDEFFSRITCDSVTAYGLLSS